MAEKTTAALFVRIPQAQARALDRLAFESRRTKQAVVSDLLARGIDERFATAIGERVEAAVGGRLAQAGGGRANSPRAQAGGSAGLPAAEGGGRRVTIETIGEPDTVVGRHAFRAFEPDVLTLEEVAELLAVEPDAVERLACAGELPGRRIGEAWRFARAAVLAWLARGAGAPPDGAAAPAPGEE